MKVSGGSWKSVGLWRGVGIRKQITLCSHELRKSSSTCINDVHYQSDSWTNVTPKIVSLTTRRLYEQPGHPLHTISELIANYLKPFGFVKSSPASPVVTVAQNFDDLDFPKDHPGRQKGESYYLNEKYLLRTHTSAHELELFEAGHQRWLLIADVYRRDQIDRSHYPAFHQCEGACVWREGENVDVEVLEAKVKTLKDLDIVETPSFSETNMKQEGHDRQRADRVARHLKATLTLLLHDILAHAKPAQAGTPKQERMQMRWIEAQFPWTQPSYELEILWHGQWLEVLGCGVMKDKTLRKADLHGSIAWAFGLGLDRLALILFGIPDIRLLWSEHPKFASQFKPNTVSLFQPWSKYSTITRDLSFWLAPDSQLTDVDVSSLAREDLGDWCQSCELIDDFSTCTRKSKTFRIAFQSLDINLTSEQVNQRLDRLIHSLQSMHNVTLR